MRFKKKPKTRKICRRFALFPVEINDEYVWLERYYIVKKWREGHAGRCSGWWITTAIFTRKEFIEWKKENYPWQQIVIKE